ncbi:hypothetical protein CONPUDRAFT_113828 [Coniophora puteana RWD-64-598 SS2]|uniref:Uncharacterized protein n=1 Tax=Coniophora puteana (strain RWD-64-598) TaxID=741705 RepID=R7SG62_CONPW|nr:uncharacterized protein CONPUDRAFT_113828 [Coniophora puteana RWD-64-598 SS2]EIW74079.1 hypothetical protein CONPUDRAFT_113828 [Coniophora puteana RWD-64-598 SS2]
MDGLYAYNMRATLHAPEPLRSDNLKRLFKRLADPHEDEIFVQNFAGEIKHEFADSGKLVNDDGHKPQFSSFANSCLKAGLVKTMMAVAREEWSTPGVPKARYIAQYHALEGLCDLMRSGDVSERQSLLSEMLREDIVGLCLRNLQHRLCLMRQLAVNTLRALAAESFLAANVPASTAADVIEGVCLYTLDGPGFVIAQMDDPETTWQSQMFMDKEDIPPKISSRYCPRFYAMAQESAMWTAHGLLSTYPPPTQEYCYGILRRKPGIIDLLLDCAILDRQPWYPENQTDSVACEVLSLLFQWPRHIVPGVVTPMDKAFRSQEWKSILQSLAILTSRQDWVEKLTEVWMRLQEEDLIELRRYFLRVEQDYGAMNPPNDEDFNCVFEYRATSRIGILRVITTLTYAAESCGVTNAQVESLLHVAYVASRNVKPSGECVVMRDICDSMENGHEIFRSPMWTISFADVADEPAEIAPESILGPTALVRLLVILAQRKALDGIQKLRKAPIGLSPSTSLRHIRQITHPEIVHRVVKMAQARLRARLDKGRQRVAVKKNDADWNFACAAFTSAAELAAALVALDVHTDGVYRVDIRGARKQLVIALGNAAQMTLNTRRYQRALHYALGAVSAAENIPGDEELDLEITEKNKRRINQAKSGLQYNR